MSTARTINTAIVAGMFTVATTVLLAGAARAHCDSTKGPVITEARAALEKGDVTPLLKWVRQQNEAEIKTAFAKAVAVRAQGAAAKELADQYFLETLVRLHRAGEGAPFTGIKDEPPEPIIAQADQALAAGSVDDLIKTISRHVAESIREKFNRVAAAQKTKDQSVAAGREFVEAYVTYVHHVEGIHAAILAAGAHHE